MRTTLFILFITMSISTGLSAQVKAMNDRAATQALSQNVTQLFSENKIKEAFVELASYWPLDEMEIEDIQSKTIKYLNIYRDMFGNPIGFTKINELEIADIATKETYFIQYRYTAIRIIFIYYQNGDGWIVNSFKWDENFKDEFTPVKTQ